MLELSANEIKFLIGRELDYMHKDLYPPISPKRGFSNRVVVESLKTRLRRFNELLAEFEGQVKKEE